MAGKDVLMHREWFVLDNSSNRNGDGNWMGNENQDILIFSK